MADADPPQQKKSFWESVTHGAKKGASAAKKTAEKSKLQAEIVMLKQQIKQAKQGMGVAIYDALSLANEAEVQRVFESAKGRVDELASPLRGLRVIQFSSDDGIYVSSGGSKAPARFRLRLYSSRTKRVLQGQYFVSLFCSQSTRFALTRRLRRLIILRSRRCIKISHFARARVQIRAISNTR